MWKPVQKPFKAAGGFMALLLLALAVSGCAPKPEAPGHPLAGDWTSPELVQVYDAPWVRALNKGKPLEGSYWHIDASGEIIPMKDGVSLPDYLKRIGQENRHLNMAGLREIGSAFPRISCRVEGDILVIDRKYADRDVESARSRFVLSEDNNRLTLTDLDTGVVDVLTRIPPAENKK